MDKRRAVLFSENNQVKSTTGSDVKAMEAAAKGIRTGSTSSAQSSAYQVSPVSSALDREKDLLGGTISFHMEIYESLHHLINHYLKTSRKMENCIQKSEYAQFSS